MRNLRLIALFGIAAVMQFHGVGFAGKNLEALDQCSRLTSFVISEIMYHPAERADGKQLEFVELFNSSSTPEDLSGYRLDGDVQFTFPAGTLVPSRGFVVVARNPLDVQSVYGLAKVFGPFEAGGSLPNNAGIVQLRHRTGAIFLEAIYETKYPWPVSADGAGHSLVLARPSYGERRVEGWEQSHSMGGSPGAFEPTTREAGESIVINEFLARTNDPDEDYIELYNHSTNAVDISGCILADDPLTNKFVLPAGTTIPAGGFAVFRQGQLNFTLSADGESIFLINATGTRILDSLRFTGQELGVSAGRFPDGGLDIYPLRTVTPGTANSGIRVSDVVINEIMYHPISRDEDDQFVELHNRGAASIDLTGWRLDDGISFNFPTNSILGPNGYFVIARNAARFRTNHPALNPALVFGDFDGRLAHSGERLALAKPGLSVTTDATGGAGTIQYYITVDEVTYSDGGRWGQWSDAGGSSLERIDVRADSRRAANWADSDETGKAPWTVFSRTGRVDNGSVVADSLQVLLQGAGECLIDEVEVINASGVNAVTNSFFEVSAGGWTAEGTEDRSGLEATEGYNSRQSYHVRAVDRGDNQLNRIRTRVTPSLASGSTATIRGKVRWLKGHPEILFRLRGNWLDASVKMELPKSPGTPGAKNSRALANSAPIISDVSHFPVLPAAGEPVIIKATVTDADDIASVMLKYRIDPSATVTSLQMVDDGTHGDEIAADGIYSVQVPGQIAGALVAWQINSTDTSGALSVEPATPAREFLVRFGETTPPGALPVYRIWMTRATLTTWANRAKLNNTPLPVTFVLGNQRVIQNATALYAGSPYISGGYDSPTGNRCGYSLAFPSDDPFLGNVNLVLDWPGGHGSEATAMQEQMGYWIADQMNLPYSHRYWIRLHVNGVTDVQRRTIFEAVIQPAGDFLDAWLPGAEEVDFYKIDRAFEFNDAGSLTADPQPRLENYTTTNGAKETERYRWTFLKRSYQSANDFSNIFNLVDALNASSPEPYTALTEQRVDIEEWIGILALEHIIVNFDAYGHQIGKNMYAAKPENGKWQLYMFDLDWLMLAAINFSANYGPATASLFNADDPTMVRMYNHPPFRRAYFRALKKAVDGPFRPELCNAVMDAKYAALVTNKVTLSDGNSLVAPTAVKNWFSTRRTFMVNQLNNVAAPFAIITASHTTNSDVATITGTAPIEVKSMRVNGADSPVQWTTVNQWSMRVPLIPGANTLNFQAIDANGAVLPISAASLIVTSTTSVASPLDRVIINEIMARPAVEGGEFLELFNTSSNRTFDLSGWRINGASFVFPDGTLMAPGSFLVVAADAGVFAQTYPKTVVLSGIFDGKLDEEGETLSLVDRTGATVDLVTYSSRPPWPEAGVGASWQLVDSTQDNRRSANWAVAQSGSGALPFTPGAANSVRRTLAPFPPVWINELQIENTTGAVDNSNEREPWLELYNSGNEPVSLSSWRLIGSTNLQPPQTNNPSGPIGVFPAQWEFPAGTVIESKGFLLVWLDGEPQESTASALHASFRAGVNSTIDLIAPVGGVSTVLDHIAFATSTTDHSIGFFPDGSGGPRQTFGFPTPAAPSNNSVQPLRVYINEWMSGNTSAVADPVDGDFEDWFELYNPNSTLADLSDFYLSDSVTNVEARWKVPAGTTIPANGFLLVWADSETGQNEIANGQLHTNFKLSQAGESIALFAPNGALIDSLTFTAQQDNSSSGRSTDGGADIQVLLTSSPGRQNSAISNSQFAVRLQINSGDVVLRWPTEAGRRYRVLYTDRLPGLPWIAATEVAGTAGEASAILPLQSAIRFYKVERVSP